MGDEIRHKPSNLRVVMVAVAIAVMCLVGGRVAAGAGWIVGSHFLR